ncbi:hypothetical protein [Methylobacterium nodulans]|uniref:Lipoprotein n=1 Tax=Methylobacterium nodulans (strain LMG 21967 / CNCM I-2342 / ORS 2060) TaxID=460265 RepID=B8IVN9_METNO|nr:hypothetical protein [Methylobacterium nodulans]ACL62479.1 hypothetical protein Mnod_8342 [Methylobacterium nodulans ORS 2060]
MKRALIIFAAPLLMTAGTSCAYAKDPWKKYYKQEMKQEKEFYKARRKSEKAWHKYHKKYGYDW